MSHTNLNRPDFATSATPERILAVRALGGADFVVQPRVPFRRAAGKCWHCSVLEVGTHGYAASELQSVGASVVVGAVSKAVGIVARLDLHRACQHGPLIAAKVSRSIAQVRSNHAGAEADGRVRAIRGIRARADIGALSDGHVGSREPLLRQGIERADAPASMRLLDGELHDGAVTRINRPRQHRPYGRPFVRRRASSNQQNDKERNGSAHIHVILRLPQITEIPRQS